LALVLLASSEARAGAVIILDPQVDGPYVVGQSIKIDVLAQLLPTGPSSIAIRELQFSLVDTSPVLAVTPIPTHLATDVHGDISFWDFSSLAPCVNNPASCGFDHTIDDSLADDQMLQLMFQGASPGAEQIILTQLAPTRIGILQITFLQPGKPYLDVMNDDDPQFEEYGAYLRFGFGQSTVEWSASEGALSGGTLYFIPEPNSLALLLGGTFLVARKRRRTNLNPLVPNP